MHILLVNDDGIHSPGLRLLAQGLRDAGHQVTVVAPDRERSAVGHGITLREPLFVGEQDWAGIPERRRKRRRLNWKRWPLRLRQIK